MEINIETVEKKDILKYQVEDKIGMKNYLRWIVSYKPKPIKLYDYDKKQNRVWFPITYSTVNNYCKQITIDFNNSKQLYEHQKEAFNAIINELDNNNCCIWQLPTWFGKSIILAHIINHYKTKTLVILPNNTLLKQIKDTLEGFGIDVSVYWWWKKQIWDITVMSARWLSLMSDKELEELPFELVIIDEAHNAMAKSVRRALVHLKHKKQLWLSATPWTWWFDSKDMNLFFWKILQFWETPLEPEFVIKKYNIESDRYFCDPSSWIEFREQFDVDEKRLAAQREYIKEMLKKHDTVLILYDRIEVNVIPQYEKLKKDLTCNVTCLHWQQNKKDRAENIASFEEKWWVMIASAAICSEWFDIPRIKAVWIFFPNKFDRKTIQVAWRALRKHWDKRVWFVHDWQDSILPSHIRERNRVYRNEFPNSKITIN